jgi:hypothetical protein
MRPWTAEQVKVPFEAVSKGDHLEALFKRASLPEIRFPCFKVCTLPPIPLSMGIWSRSGAPVVLQPGG